MLPAHSVSGFSAGASAALNHLIAYSDVVTGLGIVGGSMYGCNTVPNATFACSGYVSDGAHLENTSIPWAQYVAHVRGGYLEKRAARGAIAPLHHLVNKPVFLFSGRDDVWVYQSVMRAVAAQMRNLSANVRTKFDIYAAHAWIVDAETCAAPGETHGDACCGWKNASTTCAPPPHAAPPQPRGCCGRCNYGDKDDRSLPSMTDGWRPPINSCDFDLSGEVLRWIYGAEAVRPRAAVVAAHLIEVKQAQFLPAGWTPAKALVEKTGLVYIPAGCRAADSDDDGPRYSRNCSVHVHYHNCGGSYRAVSTSYFLENALPAYAEANGMVILYPQAAHSPNPTGAGCFDWFGATNDAFDTRAGVQLGMVAAMITGLRSDDEGLPPPNAAAPTAPPPAAPAPALDAAPPAVALSVAGGVVFAFVILHFATRPRRRRAAAASATRPSQSPWPSSADLPVRLVDDADEPAPAEEQPGSSEAHAAMGSIQKPPAEEAEAEERACVVM